MSVCRVPNRQISMKITRSPGVLFSVRTNLVCFSMTTSDTPRYSGQSDKVHSWGVGPDGWEPWEESLKWMSANVMMIFALGLSVRGHGIGMGVFTSELVDSTECIMDKNHWLNGLSLTVWWIWEPFIFSSFASIIRVNWVICLARLCTVESPCFLA